MTLSCDSFMAAVDSLQWSRDRNLHDPHHTAKSSQWLASYWVHYSKSTAVIWIDSLSFDWRRDVSKPRVRERACTAAGDALSFSTPLIVCLPVLPLPFNLLSPIHISPSQPTQHLFIILIFHTSTSPHLPQCCAHSWNLCFPFDVNCSSSMNTSSCDEMTQFHVEVEIHSIHYNLFFEGFNRICKFRGNAPCTQFLNKC